ncbi:uncharacterized protein F4807DRAFT_406187 [Annulohypoxylon truncatum]|uniref:uncharacterized protein n=1 Tax=Annulohypoxylon truncatum TaxID=327061 RepID=UPI0020084DD1|nr:uncharacterized protein F4807DRAFT_406187 [Annulohypoxylon truncatum]KAI1215173.1 hypothetical protein F4807DRAFT_406187 [Annulohypoxylon truncatum]
MTSAFREDRSHFEASSPTTSVHGGRGDDGEGAATAPVRQSDDASSTDHVQEKEAAATPLTKKQKFKRHCGRFWWWYLIGAIVLLAILLPIIFLVIIPAIVQRILNDQTMPISGGQFIAVSPTKLNVSILTSLDSPLPARIDPMTLLLYNKDTPTFSPFVNVSLPELHIKGTTPLNIKNQIVTVTNETELISWFANVFDQPTVTLSTRGDPKIHLGALHTNGHLDKTVTVNSLNKLDGFSIQDLQLLMPARENGTNIQGTLNLPNWGTLDLGIGNLSLNLMSGDLRIGLITVYDVYLPRGNNIRYFNGELFLDTLFQNIGTILSTQGDALSGGNIQINATGNATVVNGEHIRFIETILNNRTVTSTTSVVKLASDLISSFTNGSQVSIPDILDEVFGNTTFIQEVLGNWNATKSNSTSTTKKRNLLASIPRSVRGPGALSLFKLGMKMTTGKF